jgi:hypothetical protein
MRLLRYHLIENPQNWLRFLLVVGSLFISAASVFVVSQRLMTLALLAVVGLGLVVVCLRWPPLGLILAVLAGMVVPNIGPGGFNVTTLMVAFLLGLWLLDMLVRQRHFRLAPSRTLWPLLFFIVSAFLSFGVGQLSWFSFALHAPFAAQLGGLAIFILSAGTFLLVANQVRDLYWLSRITWAFLALAALVVLFRSILPAIGLPTGNLIQPVGSVFWVWLVSIACSQAVFNRDLGLAWRLVLGGLLLVTLYVLLVFKYADKSGWLPSLICIAVIATFVSWRVWLVHIPLAVLAALYLAPQLLGGESYSVSTRLDAWLILFQIIKVSPVWGLGFGNYYWYTPLFPIRGYAVSFNSHNNYVDIAAQTGIIGLACFLWLMWEACRLGWRLYKTVPDGFAQAFVVGALAGLAGTVVVAMLGDWVLPFVYNIGLNGFRGSMLAWLFLGGLVSLEQMRFAPRPDKPTNLVPRRPRKIRPADDHLA